MPTTPPEAVNSEDMIRNHTTTYFKDGVRRALRAAFAYMHAQGAMVGFTELPIANGIAAHTTQAMRPDLAIFPRFAPLGTGTNRAPGDIKPF